jgi:hypothetical protein
MEVVNRYMASCSNVYHINNIGPVAWTITVLIQQNSAELYDQIHLSPSTEQSA